MVHLLHIGAQQGEKIPVNGLLCIIGEKGKVDVDAIVAALKNGGESAGSDSKQINRLLLRQKLILKQRVQLKNLQHLHHL